MIAEANLARCVVRGGQAGCARARDGEEGAGGRKVFAKDIEKSGLPIPDRLASRI